MTLGEKRNLLALAAAIGGAGWWFYGHIAMSNEDHEEQQTLVEAVKKISTYIEKQETVKEAEAAQMERLCRQGKVDRLECPQHWIDVTPPEDDD